MIPEVEIRSRFKQFAGEKQFTKFIAALHKNTLLHERLRFWQEVLWGEFVEKNPDCQLSHTRICTTFRICELHFEELLPKYVPVLEGCVDYAPDYERDQIQLFPHASPDFVSTEGRTQMPKEVEIWYCPVCDNLRAVSRWRVNNDGE